MWLFLVTEVMFFGGLFMAYLLYRVWYPEAWAEGSLELDIALGGFNTVVLIGSSLTMAMAVRAAQTGWRTRHDRLLVGDDGARADLPGRQVLRIQAQVRAPPRPRLRLPLRGPARRTQVEIFFSLYFTMTGLHALHMVIGFGHPAA